ncbi:hypothetical protein R3I93_018856 [Phoxinus phoxinus]|uniref:Somatostatin/Cortistatin C-terminal domain-containing protein n=1 Tax=Phoxinus phoxinus TaxID=58324 RepID=A0AAN9CFN4_9TELE
MFLKVIRSHFSVFSAVPGARRLNGNLKEKEGGVVLNYTLEREHTATDCTQQNGVRAAALLPVEERNLAQSRELSKERKELILKLISGLLDGVDNSVLAGEIAPVPMDVEEPLESRLEERAVYNRLSQLPQRDRKAPCKNFFWKTFTSC